MKLVVFITFTAAAAAIIFATGIAAENNFTVSGAEARGDKDELLSSASGAKKNATNATTSTSSKPSDDGEGKNTETKSLSRKLLESQNDLRDYVSSQMNQVYEILNEMAKSTDSQKILTMDVNEVPAIANVFYVGKFNKTYKLADMQYTNVKVYGLSDFKNYVFSVDQNQRKAKATLVANQLKIEGNYSLSNFLKHVSGSFTVKLLDNVTYTEDDLYCKFKNEVDIAAGETTITYGRSEYDYRNLGMISIFFEGVISNKLTEEILYRVGKELGHRIRHVIISKIKQITSRKDPTASGRYNRIASIVQSSVSQIRTWLNKTTAIKLPLPGVYHKMKVHRNTIAVSNITLSGLNTMHLSEQITAYREKNDFYINIEGEAGPLVVGGKVMISEVRNGTFESTPLNVDYQVSRVRAKIVVSCLLSDDRDSLQVNDLQVSVSQPKLKMQPGKIDFKPDELEQLAEFLKPDVESQLYKWLKDFVNDTFRRANSAATTSNATVDVSISATPSRRSLVSEDNPPDMDSEKFYS